MPWSCNSKKAACETSDDGNVIQLGFNISVAGKSASDFEIFVNDKKQSCGQLSSPNLDQITSSAEVVEEQKVSSKSGSAEEKSNGQTPLDLPETEDAIVKSSRHQRNEKTTSSATSFATEGIKSSRSENVTIIDEIKNAMGNFEKFSEHLREIPRLSATRMPTSTPYSIKNNSRSEGNLSLYGHVPRSYIPKYDFRDRKCFKKPKPLSSDLFLKPLPAEDYFKKGFVRRYYDVESYHHYASVENLPYYYDFGSEWKSLGKATAKSDNDKSDAMSSASDVCVSENKAFTKKEGNEPIDKQSTSSESTKDIKIYQSGGIIIMQNFKDSADLLDNKDLVDSVKLIENCNKLSEKMESSLHSSDESQKLLLNSSSDDVKGHSTKFVQFDLSLCENTKSKSYDSSSDMPKNDCIEPFKSDLLNTRNALLKEKDTGLIFLPNQDFISLSTQENDSVVSNVLGMSPTSSTSGKKLEWDSGADVGYLNTDLTKENISTIERIILKGLSDDGVSKKKVVYQRTEQETVSGPSKSVDKQMPSELEIDAKNASTCRRSSSDQSNGPSGVADTSTTTSLSLSSHSFSDGAGIFVQKKEQFTGKDNSSKTEKHQTFSSDKSNKGKNSKKLKVVQKYQNLKHKKPEKTLDEATMNEATSVCRVASGEEKCVQTLNIDIKDDIVTSLDKSTYVNTLFSDLCFENLSRSEESGHSESSDKFGPHHGTSPRAKKLKKKRSVVQGGNLTARLKDKIETIIDMARHSNRSNNRPKSSGFVDSSGTTDVNHNVEDGKLEEIEHTETEQKVSKADPTSVYSLEKSNQKDKVVRSRPISASSSSVRTVMPNKDASENVQVLEQVKHFSDQMIQTCKLICESKGVQAFQSAKCSAASSQLGDGTTCNVEELLVDISGVEVLKDDGECKSVAAFSKSIQAPGMNFSLPRHLSYPKLTDSCGQMNTKGTQFFGCPITSLPNYHSNVPLRETIEGKGKVLKNKINSNTENNWVKQENMKNIVEKIPKEREVVIEYEVTREDNGNSKSVDDRSDEHRKGGSKGIKNNRNDIEDKENLFVDEEELTDCSKHLSNCSRKESITNCSVNNGSKKSDSMVFGSCEVFPSDDGRNIFLTSEVLKEHGDRIDRSIIQEKYFQSQLLELERRKMISRTTSMEKKSEHDRNTQTSFSPAIGVSVSCQHSPTLLNLSEEIFCPKENSGKNTKGIDPSGGWTEQNGSDEGDSPSKNNKGKRFNSLEAFSYGGFALAESLSSDTQTADSWVPGGQEDSVNQQCPQRIALSVESLADHIYDDPAGLKEKSVDNTERNLQLGDSAQSNGTYSTPATNSGNKDSESGHTLVLENTDRSPLESERMKSLDNNLTELELVVSRLHEKEAIFQKITDSVLSAVSKVDGSGDSSHNDKENRSNDNSNASEEICREGEIMQESSKSDGSEGRSRRIPEKGKEMSTACQTDTLKLDHTLKFDEEKKKLEQRMNDKKEQQIKWIENEIKHLNMLRSLLEKQEDIKNSAQRKKRHHYLTEAAEGRSATSSLKEEILRNILVESLSKTSSSTKEIANGDQLESKGSPPLNLTEKSMSETLKLSAPFPTKSHGGQLGMALSLRRIDNVREVTMLPVGIQVTLRDKKERLRASTLPEKRDSLHSEKSDIRTRQSLNSSATGYGRRSETQVPRPGNQYDNTTSTTGSIDSMNRCLCFKCNNSRCICLKTADGSNGHKQSRSSSRQGRTREPGSAYMSGETSTKQGLDIPEIRDIADSRRDSPNEIVSADVTHSRDSSKQPQSYTSSEGSIPYEKCLCCCHAQPLPRCDICQLLNTCKKCQCYRKIKCCICEISASKVPLRKKCLTVTTSCYCQSSPCQTCPCSSVKNQICQTCPCHITPCESSQRKCIKRFKERSCQTEGKDCKSFQPREEDLYRETKYMTERKRVIENRKPSDVVYPAEQRYERESRQAVDEKYPCQMKVLVEEKKSAEVKNSMQMKTGLENLCSEEFQKLPVKEFKGKKQCRCNNRQMRRKSFDDHSRNYFLQIQETTEEESSESGDNRNSMEVITIKVPIRKVYGGRNIQSSPQRTSWKTKENDVITGNKYSDQKVAELFECDCCEDCVGHSHKRSSYEERSRTVDYSYPRSYDIKKHQSRDRDTWECCEECSGRAKLEERPRSEFAICDDYEQRKTRSMSYIKFNGDGMNEHCRNCSEVQSNKPLKYPPDDYRCQDTETDFSGICNCCDCCATADEEDRYVSQAYSTCPEFPNTDGTSVCRSDAAFEVSSTTESEVRRPSRAKENDQKSDGKTEKNSTERPKVDKHKKDGDKCKKIRRKSPPPQKPAQQSHKPKIVKVATQEKCKDKRKNTDYYNFNKKEFMTKSELEREEKKKRPPRLTLQECLTVKRPDLYTRAECRRKIISEKSKDRAERHNKRMECLTKCLPKCEPPVKNPVSDLKLFTSEQMRKQTQRFYKKLPEVTNKQAEEKKKMQFRTNRIMAEIFAKKLQLQTLKGQLNMSNSFTVMSTM